MRRRSFLALTASLALVPLARTTTAQTPVAVDGDTGLMALLRLLPDDAPGDTGIRYADYSRQLAALGIAETGAGIDPDAWNAAMGASLMIPSSMAVPLDPMWREGLGFDLRDVDQMVETGASDESILLLNGRFDAASLTAAWEAGGYTPTETGGVTWHTLGADNVLFDPEVPLSDWHLGALSHLALLEDGTVVGTAKRAAMEQVLALHAGEGQSFADGSGASLAAAPADLAVGWIVDGTALIAVGDPLAAMANNPNVAADVQERLATQAAEMAEEAPRMPPIALALVGATAGVATALTAERFTEGPKARAIVVAVPQREADGAMVAETVTRRLTTLAIPVTGLFGGTPYAEAFPGMVVETTPTGAVVIALEPAPEMYAGDVIRLMQAGQLSILFWGG
jgi:hypothetical protein